MLSASVTDTLQYTSHWYQNSANFNITAEIQDPWYSDPYEIQRGSDDESWISYKAATGHKISSAVLSYGEYQAKMQVKADDGTWTDLISASSLNQTMPSGGWNWSLYRYDGFLADEIRAYIPATSADNWWRPLIGTVDIALDEPNLLSTSISDTLVTTSHWYDNSRNVSIASGSVYGIGADPWTSNTNVVQRTSDDAGWFAYHAAPGHTITGVVMNYATNGYQATMQVQADDGTWHDMVCGSAITQASGWWTWHSNNYNGFVANAVRVYIPATSGGNSYRPAISSVAITLDNPILLSSSITDKLNNTNYMYNNSATFGLGNFTIHDPWDTSDLYEAQRRSGAAAWFSYKTDSAHRITGAVLDSETDIVGLIKMQSKQSDGTWADLTRTSRTSQDLWSMDTFTNLMSDEVRVYMGTTSDDKWWVALVGTVSFNVAALSDLDVSSGTYVNYSDDVRIDGDLSEWVGATWVPLTYGYDQYPFLMDGGDIVEAYAAFKWGDGGRKLYTAVKVNDNAHKFTDTYGIGENAWASRDAVEVYQHTKGTTGNYATEQETAQHWACGITDTDKTVLWRALGDATAYTPTDDDIIAKGYVGSAATGDADFIYYEMATTPYSYFAGRWNADNPTDLHTSIVSPLAEGDLISLSAIAVANNGSGYIWNDNKIGYTGMASESAGGGGGWWGTWSNIPTRTLVRSGLRGTITLQDYSGSTVGATVSVVITDSTNHSETHNLVLDASSLYSFTTSLSGTCTATAQAPGYASQSKSVALTNGKGSVSFVLSKLAAASLTDVKNQVGSTVSTSGVVTAVFGSTIYIENTDRTSGIRVDNTTNVTIANVGKVANVVGTVQIDTTQEVFINASSVDVTTQPETVLPLGMNNKALGGGVLDGQAGVASGTGLNNIGLLIRTTGNASAGNADGFTLDDGSGVTPKVLLSGVGSTYNGKYVTVTGISSIGADGVRVIRALNVQSVN